MVKRFMLFFLVLDFLLLAGIYLRQRYVLAHPLHTRGEEVEVILTRGPFTVYNFVPGRARPRAILIFGSGDGGWSDWEEKFSQTLSLDGYQVVGVDSADYARTDYDLATLQTDFGRIAERFLSPYGATPPPLLEGGWSMGAAQAVAIGGGPNPPRDLAGVIVASMLDRGRYGLRLSDKLNILPTGRGTFSPRQFAGTMRGLRVVQMHGDRDGDDSRAWLKDLRAPYRECDLSGVGHNFSGPGQAFFAKLTDGLSWILSGPAAGARAASNP